MSESLRPEESPGLLLWRTSLCWQRQISGVLKPFGLTHVQFVLLASVWWLDRKAGVTPNQQDLANHAAIDAMMTSQVIRVLTERGLVTRTRDSIDARAIRISITDVGAELALRTIKIVEAADHKFFSVVSDISALMNALRETVEQKELD